MKKKLLALTLVGALALSNTGCLGIMKTMIDKSTEVEIPENDIEDYVSIDDDTDDITVDTEEDIDDITTESVEEIDTDATTENTGKIIMKDEKTGKDLFTVVTHEYYDAFSDDEKIFSFVEPDGWVLDREYIDSEDGYTGTLFFLDDEERSTIEIGCMAPDGISYFYYPDEYEDELEDATKFELVKEDIITDLNPYGYDIFKYNYTFDDGTAGYQYIAITYIKEDGSFVITLPESTDSNKFDTLEETIDFINTNF